MDKLMLEDGVGSRDLTLEEKFNFFAFGDYSKSFTFGAGSGVGDAGLVGQTYYSGNPAGVQNIHCQQGDKYPRFTGVEKWGLQTFLSFPVPSPNVGPVIVVLYSIYFRTVDKELAYRLLWEFERVCLERI